MIPITHYNKKYVLSNSESVQCSFFIFDHVTFNQFTICCCVQNFIEIEWFFAKIWWYIDFQNGGRPPSWNYFTTIRDHPRSLWCWPQPPVKFHVNVTVIHRSEDIPIWIFRIFVEFYLYPTVSTALIYLFKPESNKWDRIEFGERSNWVVLGIYGNHRRIVTYKIFINKQLKYTMLQ